MTARQAIEMLQKSFPGEALDAEFLAIYELNGQRASEPIIAFGMIPQGDSYMIAAITQSEVARVMIRDGKPMEIGKISPA
jgi:hypothetical protein